MGMCGLAGNDNVISCIKFGLWILSRYVRIK